MVRAQSPALDGCDGPCCRDPRAIWAHSSRLSSWQESAALVLAAPPLLGSEDPPAPLPPAFTPGLPWRGELFSFAGFAASRADSGLPAEPRAGAELPCWSLGWLATVDASSEPPQPKRTTAAARANKAVTSRPRRGGWVPAGIDAQSSSRMAGPR